MTLHAPIGADIQGEQVATNGAGDNFFAGFLYGHLQGYGVRRCLELGTIVGGLCVTSHELVLPDLSPALVEREYHQHYSAWSFDWGLE